MKLEEGELICPQCKGDNNGICFKCGGTGKIDWVDLCTGNLKFGTWTLSLPKIRKMYPKSVAKDIAITWDEIENET
jgi:hypothetical protein